MVSFTASNIIAMSIIAYLCLVTPGASGTVGQGPASLSRDRPDASKPTKPIGLPRPTHDNRYNKSTSAPRATAVRRDKDNNKKGNTQRDAPLRGNMIKSRAGEGKPLARSRAATPTKRRRQNEQPTPEPTGDASSSTTVYVSSPNAFALLLPRNSGGKYPIYFFLPAVVHFFVRRDGVRCRGRRYCILHGWKRVRKPFPKRVYHRGCVLGSSGRIIRAGG